MQRRGGMRRRNRGVAPSRHETSRDDSPDLTTRSENLFGAALSAVPATHPTKGEGTRREERRTAGQRTAAARSKHRGQNNGDSSTAQRSRGGWRAGRETRQRGELALTERRREDRGTQRREGEGGNRLSADTHGTTTGGQLCGRSLCLCRRLMRSSLLPLSLARCCPALSRSARPSLLCRS